MTAQLSRPQVAIGTRMGNMARDTQIGLASALEALMGLLAIKETLRQSTASTFRATKVCCRPPFVLQGWEC